MRIAVAVTGASGLAYARKLIEELKKNHTVKVIASNAAIKIMQYEGRIDYDYKEEQIDAETASGSSKYDAMIVCPCSMKTLSAIAHGFGNNLITRSVDVMIKERKRLVLVVRETPLSPIHLENMLKLSRLGITILPACPGFYHKPSSIEDLVNFIVGKILDSLGIDNQLYNRWGDEHNNS